MSRLQQPWTVSRSLAPDALLELRVAGLWRFLRRQPASYWLICLYLMLEYVRPQSVWTVLDVLPWTWGAILLCLGAVLLEKGTLRFKTLASGLLFLFTLVVLLSSLTAWDPEPAWAQIDLILSWVLVYTLIINTVTTERRYLLFLLSFLLYSLKMSQHGARIWWGIGLGFQDWGATGGPGWFHNSGEFGIQMCVFLPLSLYFLFSVRPHIPRWKEGLLWIMPLTAVMSMIGSSSRGALVGGGAVGLWMTMRSRYRVRAGLGVALATALVVFLTPPEQKDRFSTMGEDRTSQARITLWKNGIEIANQYPVLGIGYKNWSPYSARFYGSPLLPHNIFIEAWAELGYPGLIVFLSMISATFIVNHRTRRLAGAMGEAGRFLHHSAYGLDGALIGYLSSGFFVTVLYYPYFWINLAMTAALFIAAERKYQELRRISPQPASHKRSAQGLQTLGVR